MAAGSEKCAQSEASPSSAHRGLQAPGQCQFRAACSEDLPALQVIEAEFPGDRLSPRALRHHLRSEHAQLRVAECDGVVCGYSLLLRHRRRRDARLYSIAVAAAARRQGLGARLLVDAEAALRAAGGSGVRLEVRADNLPALALYRAHGYHPFGRRAGYYEDGMDALCLRRSLAEIATAPRTLGA